MSYLFCFIFITSSFATLASDELLVHLKLKNYINDISNLSERSKAAKCGDIYNSNCPDVHVSKWCQEQDEILKTAPLEKRPNQDSKEKSILFLAEEHGDENAYDYYEKLISKKEFDCLFLELPSVFQKNFDHRKGIVHERTTFINLKRKQNESEVSEIQLKNSTYLDLLKSLVQKAKSNDVKVILVDSSKRSLLEKGIKDSLGQRNETMAKNIKAAFDKKAALMDSL